MPRYYTSLSQAELDRVIEGDRPIIDLLPFAFRHKGEREQDQFVLRRPGMSIRGNIERHVDGFIIVLKPRTGWLYFLGAVIALVILYMGLFAENLTINGTPATDQTRILFLPVMLLLPLTIVGMNRLVFKLWMAKIERTMKLERLA